MIILLLLGIFFNSWTAQGADSKPFLKYLKAIQEHDPKLKDIEKQYQAQDAFFLSQTQEWNVSISLTHEESDENSPATNSIISSSIPETGSSVSIGRSISRSNSVAGITTTDNLEISQKVWQNGFSRLYNSEQDQLKAKVTRNHLERDEALEAHWFSRVQLYLDWLRQILELDIQQEILNESKSLYGYVKKRFESSIARESELLEVEVSVIEQKANIAAIRAQIKQIEQDIEQMTRIKLPNRISEQGLPRLPINLEQSAWRSFRILASETSLDEMELDDAKELEKTDADLYVGARRVQNNVTSYEEFYAGVSLLLPVRNHSVASSVKYRESQLEWTKSKKGSLQIETQQLEAELKASMKALKTQIQSSKEGLKLLERIKVLRLSRYQNSRISFRELADAQAKLNSQRLKLLDLKLKLKSEQLRFSRDTDQLLLFIRAWLG
ncbi:TolC family protein [Pseudobacteriovorax antillogorgiicola]|uniref:Outer membrane protein TolC n=1 Tax=Pseudobacteriovorax antillogorgiicola TaxID=1513793 RepID=A0A1Y6CDA7_9BACT|nr:TolC family protein [Pseudobacteriovorax antillogorgiicola]TCS47911.1 outer membrane protein TolC [Pseudobacteriovorax antillogorgiicola]SMF57848.1 Outer membrane protein TolC [Pseudobacteriovorax antillogorgiicola]